MADETGTSSEDAVHDSKQTNPELEAALKELKLQKESSEAQRRQYQHFQQQYEARIAQLERATSRSGGYEREQDSGGGLTVLEQQLRAQAEDMGVMRYKLETPDWREKWDKVQEIIYDPTQAAEVAVFTKDGQPDYFRSLKNAHVRVELEELRKAKAKMAEVKEGQKKEQDRQKAQATVSGVSASEGEEEIDLDSLTSDDMIERGLVQGPPNDPIRPLRPKT